jgi:hypothetical protein
MLTIDQTRKILGKNAEGLTDEQLTEIRDGYYHLVNIIFDKWQEDRKAGKINAKGQTVPSLETPAEPSPAKKPRHRKQ